MKLAVVQHSRRTTPSEDSAALIARVAEARTKGAEVAVLPHLPWLSTDDVASIVRAGSEPSELQPTAVLVGAGSAAEDDPAGTGVVLELTPLGTTVALTNDECLDPAVARDLAMAEPDAVVLRPGSESDLQAEAVLERALGLSEAASGLVVVAETEGGADGEPGHGGSAIVVLGEVAAEAQPGEDLLLVDVRAPVGQPDARMPLPELPPILAQRLAIHRGQRLSVDYPADLS